MLIRAFSSASLGLFVTLALLFVMQTLISSRGGAGVEVNTPEILDWIRLPEEEILLVDDVIPAPIPEPPVPPATRPPELQLEDGNRISMNIDVPKPPGDDVVIGGFADGNEPLINVMKVQPNYPPSAATRGIEGTVLVRFDVSEMGTVENAVVVESSHRIFERAAIEAAYRFKYRPAYIDGVPQPSRGLEQLFRFRMDQ